MRVQALLLLAACSFSANSSGHSGPSGIGDGESTTGGTTEAATAATKADAIESSSSESGAPADSDSSGLAESTSGEVDCSDGATIVAAFVPVGLIAPMVSDVAPAPIGDYAYSTEPDAGSVTFAFDVACMGDYALWGLVYDANTDPFVDGGNADSFLVRVDNGPILEWSYGCTTLFQLDAWSYERVQVAAVADCSTPEAMLFRLEPGPHTVTFRNIEAGTHGDEGPGSVAAIARVVLSDREGYTPDPDLD